MPARRGRRGRLRESSERKAYRKPPTQERARATVDVILQAARGVLTRRGYSKFTTNEVAKAAGVSIGSLYQYFPNKRALVGAIYEDHVERKVRELAQETPQLATASLEALIQRFAEWMVESHRDDPTLHRIIVEELPRHGLTPKLAGAYEAAIASTKLFLERHASELTPQNHELSAFIVIHTMESLTKAAIARNPEMLNDELTREIAALLTRYLKRP